MNICNEIQQKIAELEFKQVIENLDDLQHIESCPDCQEYQQACDELNQAMTGMGNFDADEALVESTINSILSLQEENKKPKSLLNTQWASALAASFMLVSLIALFPFNSVSNFGIFSDTNSAADSMLVSDEEKQKIKKRKEALSKDKQDDSGFEFTEVEIEEKVYMKQRRIPKKPPPPSNSGTIDFVSVDQANSVTMNMAPAQDLDANISPESLGRVMEEEFKQDAKKELAKLITSQSLNSPQVQDELISDEPLEESVGVKLNSDGVGQALVYPDYTKNQDNYQRQDGRIVDDNVELLEKVIPTGSRISSNNSQQPAPVSSISKEQMRENTSAFNLEEFDENDEQVDELKPITVTGRRMKGDDYNESAAKNYAGLFKHRSASSKTREVLFQELTPAQQFLSKMNSLYNLDFQTATGYWANNYLPGDASMRLLGGDLIQKKANIKSIVEQNKQPFDYPSTSALAVYLSSDHANIEAQKPTRMKLQVGIQASNRKGGHRSAMNIGIVFDIKNNNSTSQEKMKALLLALLKAKQSSDNISVYLAGTNGGELIKAKDFRYGSIQATMNRLTSNDNAKQSVTLSLHQAIKLASVNLQKEDDPSASLGSSVVMLVTDKSIENMSSIETSIHKNAVEGITLSTVSLGNDNQQALNQLALAGQGHARVLQNANDAKRVIEAELLASSRAVARALRLRIRLAKGVKLIKVLDSYNLNEKQAQRVRDAENSLDQRLSKNLGIQADRGEDEEGIQIVIPSFFAGDTHVVILDVVVNNPGAIADVSLRYKDLLYLRNAISRKQLNLDNDEKSLGPLQLNVIKNILSSHFAKDIKKGSIQLKKGNELAALGYLMSLKELYQSMRLEFPAWNNDVEILKDEKLIQQYIELIKQTTKNDAPQVNYIVDSLQYISWRKNITQSK